ILALPAHFAVSYYADPLALHSFPTRRSSDLMGKGFPDSGNVKSGSRAIKYHLDYMAFLLDHRRWLAGDVMTLADFAAAAHLSSRSEEHTSELQSRENLVCRLLLEKKKKITVQ